MSALPEIESLRGEVAELRNELRALQKSVPNKEDAVSIVCFSGDWDRLFAAFTIAGGALALGQEVHLFFTFWGAASMRRSGRRHLIRSHWMQTMMGHMLPDDVRGAPLSKMHFFGLGKWIVGLMMKHQGVDDLPTLIEQCRELGANFHYCDTSLSLFGWGNNDVVEGENAEWCGVSTFLSKSLKGRVTLFI